MAQTRYAAAVLALNGNDCQRRATLSDAVVSIMDLTEDLHLIPLHTRSIMSLIETVQGENKALLWELYKAKTELMIAKKRVVGE